jgi:hypothetical protein
MSRTSAYRFTVQMKDGKPVETQAHLVEALRKTIAVEDAWKSTRRYVKLQGRGPRPTRRYHQSLPLSMAVTADVYVYNR